MCVCVCAYIIIYRLSGAFLTYSNPVKNNMCAVFARSGRWVSNHRNTLVRRAHNFHVPLASLCLGRAISAAASALTSKVQPWYKYFALSTTRGNHYVCRYTIYTQCQHIKEHTHSQMAVEHRIQNPFDAYAHANSRLLCAVPFFCAARS